MQTLVLKTTQGECPIHVGAGIAEQPGDFFDRAQFSGFALIADKNVPASGYTSLRRWLGSSLSLDESIAVSEVRKSIDTVTYLWGRFLAAGLDRHSLVIAVGGGALSDLVGFAASTYLRGTNVLYLPTTLLAQADAAVGGKNGINFGGVKNTIGTLHQPVAVVSDTSFLRSLSPREFASGMAEIIKCGVIADTELCAQLMDGSPTPDAAQVAAWVYGACRVKVEIVARDEQDRGDRRLLNFGHTVGHALEAAALESEHSLLHGEAVSLGMLAEAHISKTCGLISSDVVTAIERLLRRFALPVRTDLDPQVILPFLSRDKKRKGSVQCWTLLSAIGRGLINQVVPHENVLSGLDYIRA